MEHNKAELREELPCFPESGMEPTVGSIMLMSSGTQSCEFTLLSYTDFEIFLAACWIQVLLRQPLGFPLLLAPMFLLQLLAHSQGPSPCFLLASSLALSS